MSAAVNVAIVGATGAVGQEFLTVLAERDFPIRHLKLLASARSAGKRVEYRGQPYVVEELTRDSFKDVHVAFFSAGGSISKEFAPAAVAAKAVVVDNTSAFRMKEGIPLVVPEVNPEQIQRHNGLIANPNCSTIIMNVPVWPLHKANRVKRIIVSTYQAVSGAGAWGLYELDAQLKAYANGQPIAKEKFPHQIVNNLFSHNTKVAENGYNEEENKMVQETRKIFNDPKIMVTATCIRVPVPRAHSESINIEFERELSAEQAQAILREAPGILLVDKREAGGYVTPVECVGEYATYVSRVRDDSTVENGLSLWCVSDNLRKGAALNAVQIAELLGRRHLQKAA